MTADILTFILVMVQMVLLVALVVALSEYAKARTQLFKVMRENSKLRRQLDRRREGF